MKIEEEILKLCILYFELRNAFNLGYQKYSLFKNMIRYITNIYDPKDIRKIFQKLIDRQFFKKLKRKKKTLYHFNPYDKPLPIKDSAIHF
tara:strand:- start:5441 stop:5710 length:270 start_codon:yes stop_codon:yes gene_type:complete